MKILRVIHTMNPVSGGPCQGIRNIVPLLKQQGIENEVLSMDDEEEIRCWKDPFLIHAIGHSRGPWAYNNRLIPWLEKHIKGYDLVIIHGLWLYHSVATARVILKKKNRPHLWIMPHGMLDPYFQRAEGRRWKALRNKIYWKWVESKVVNQADAVLFTCQEELLLARTTFSNYQPLRELNIGYGVPSPPGYLPQSSRPYLLFLSRIHEKKGVDILLKAYLRLKRERAMPDLVVAGPGLETVYGQQLKRQAEQDDQICFVGMLQGEAKWRAFYGCEAFVLPSHQENFGIAVVEALACAKPVLISNRVNIWREIEEGKAGLVDEDTEEGVYRQLKRWEGLGEEQRKNMRTHAEETFRRHFSIAAAAWKLTDVLGDWNKDKRWERSI